LVEEKDKMKDEVDNILKALLYHLEEVLAIEYMGYYSDYLN
jgi:hypothetical protein